MPGDGSKCAIGPGCLFISESVRALGVGGMSRGGRRAGAGRPGRRVKAEELARIDVRQWARLGLLAPGRQERGTFRMPGCWAELAQIETCAQTGALLLALDSCGGPVRQHVPILATPCTFGGARQWFACPDCGRRVALLYLHRGGFACRPCQDVAYASQSEDIIGRSWRRQRQLEARLGPERTRPKGMHWRTYGRLLWLDLPACELRRWQTLADVLLPRMQAANARAHELLSRLGLAL